MKARETAGQTFTPIDFRTAGNAGKNGGTTEEPREEWVPSMVQPAAVQPAAKPAKVKTTGRTLDIRDIPIGVEIEMGGFPWETLVPALKRAGINVAVFYGHDYDASWNPRTHWRLGWDSTASTTKGVGGEMSSRIMTIREGALDEIRKVFRIMKECGGTGVPMAAFHIHIGAKEINLSPNGIANLIKMELQHEPVIYRIAQNGQPTHRDDANEDRQAGNGQRGSTKYCKPLSVMHGNLFPLLHATTMDEVRTRFYQAAPLNTNFRTGSTWSPGNRDHPSRYYGWNFNRRFTDSGTIEYRFPNYSDNVEDYIAHVLLALNMVRAAEEQEWELEEVHPWYTEREKPVSEDRLHELLDRTVGEGETKNHLMRLFTKSGGKVTRELSPPDPLKGMAAQLWAKQCRFTINGTEVTPTEAVEAVRTWEAMRTVKGAYLTPFAGVQVRTNRGNTPLVTDSKTLKQQFTREFMASGDRGEEIETLAKQDPALVNGAALCRRLAEGGTRFFNGAGEELPSQDRVAPFLLLDAGTPIQVILPGESVPIPIAALGELAKADAILRGEAGPFSPAEQEMLRTIRDLQGRGVAFRRLVKRDGGATAAPCATSAAVLLRFGKDPVSADLPRRVRWGLAFKRSVAIESADDLRTLAARLS